MLKSNSVADSTYNFYNILYDLTSLIYHVQYNFYKITFTLQIYIILALPSTTVLKPTQAGLAQI
jgi:hypothetical protein